MSCQKCASSQKIRMNPTYSSLESYSDIKKIGQGIWCMLFILAYRTKTTGSKKDKDTFINTIETLSTELPCQTCKDHFQKYILTNSVTIAATNNQLMEWTYRCKVAADKNGGKVTTVPYDAVLNYFSAISKK